MKKIGQEMRPISTPRDTNQDYYARYTPDYFMKSGQRVLEIAIEMESALAEASSMPKGLERKTVLWGAWRILRNYISELLIGIQELPNMQENGFRYWKIDDVVGATELAVKHEDDEALRDAITRVRQIGMAIDAAMQGVSPTSLTVAPGSKRPS